MKYKIFHNPKPDFQEVSLWEDIQDYELVGIIHADSLEDAYRLSQNYDFPWNSFTRDTRSTSVGDVIQDELGDMYSVANKGFILIRPDVLPEQ